MWMWTKSIEQKGDFTVYLLKKCLKRYSKYHRKAIEFIFFCLMFITPFIVGLKSFPEELQTISILFQDDFDGSRTMNFPGMGGRIQDNFQLPVPFPFPHPAAAFLPPMAPQPTAPSSGSSHSSEGSASSQHTWSFEEQFKQVRQVGRLELDDVWVRLVRLGEIAAMLRIVCVSFESLWDALREQNN